jgi:hypothetical protein
LTRSLIYYAIVQQSNLSIAPHNFDFIREFLKKDNAHRLLLSSSAIKSSMAVRYAFFPIIYKTPVLAVPYQYI